MKLVRMSESRVALKILWLLSSGYGLCSFSPGQLQVSCEYISLIVFSVFHYHCNYYLLMLFLLSYYAQLTINHQTNKMPLNIETK
uniref:Uncharacterized protein n=1 Tax=Tetranychus urticae TaxID=32264 RepID=T1JZ91_TETUR